MKKNILKILSPKNVRHVWIFITDKCNLNCDYCFFAERTNKLNLSFKKLLSLFNILEKGGKYNFVISGGEPLLYWNLIKNALPLISKSFNGSNLTLQTNMCLLDKEKLQTLCDHKVKIEPGIDGCFSANMSHRYGLTKMFFKKMNNGIDSCRKLGLKLQPTMTVHPSQTGTMVKNFTYLISKGFDAIEVHPAFMADWQESHCRTFLGNYLKLLAIENGLQKNLIGKNYHIPRPFFFDLVIQPDGNILPNWTFLAFPVLLRKKFYLFKLLEHDLKINEKNFLSYLNPIKDYFFLPRTYREFSNFNACLMLQTMHNDVLLSRFLQYSSLCKQIQELDCYSLKQKRSHREH